MIGRVLTRYKLLEEVGQGGMAVVYRGVDMTLGREVAVKVLHPHLATLAESRARLEREAQAVAKLHHDNILEIYDYSGPESPERFLVTEYIHGQTLTAFVKQHPIQLPEIAEMIVAEVTGALEHAHGLGVIHRDVKPENVMIRSDGLIKLTDFGIAQIVDKDRLTVTGQLLGSPAYMAPEHVEGGRIDVRTDVFAAGILLYQLAVGELPFRGKNPHEVLKKIAECRYAPPEQVNPLIGGRLARIIRCALSRLPQDRYSSVGEMRREILADLADSGMSNVRVELRRFFAAPADWTAAFKTRLVATLGERGRMLAGTGKRTQALAAWNRALTLAPADSTVNAMVAGMAGRRRRWQLAVLAGLALAAAGGTVAAARMLRASTPKPDMGSPLPTLFAGDPVAGSIEGAGGGHPEGPAAVKPPRLATAIRVEARRIAPPVPARPAAGTRDVQILTYPHNVSIFVDGQFVGDYNGPPIKVGPGPHELAFHSSCCATATAHLAADATKTEFVKLVWKSARVVVTTSPDGADILYSTSNDASQRLVRGGQPIAISIPKESESGDVEVHLTVSAPGYRSQNLNVKVSAGQTIQRSIDLARTS